MRDVVLTALIGALLLAVFRNPAIGPLLWAWMSLMNPHRLTYGFAQQLGFAQIIAAVTLIALVFTRQRYPMPLTPVSVTWVLLLIWMSVTSLFAINLPDVVLERWIFVMKMHLMVFVTIVLIRSRKHLEWLIWVVTLSVIFYGVKGGLWTVLTGGGNRVRGPGGSMIEDNNALAVALIMLVPFLYYLFQVSVRPWARRGLVLAIGVTCLGILGSQSRGALLGVLAMATMLGLKSKHPIRVMLALGVLLAMGFMFMPDSWTERMNTIKEYRADDSAMSRVYTWTTLWNLAVDRPFVGGGFRSDYQPIFFKYAPTGPEFESFQGMYWVAHSIYFQMLGEHGFVGLFLFLGVGIFTWWRAAWLAKVTRDDPEFGSWVPKLMPMLQASLIGFGVGGAFLSLAYFDLPYYLMTYVIVVDALVRARKASAQTTPYGAPFSPMEVRPQVQLSHPLTPDGTPRPPSGTSQG